jgi:hypothetical protein
MLTRMPSTVLCWRRTSASKSSIILMRETEGPAHHDCSVFISGLSGEWQEVAQDFRNKNARAWLLQPAKSLGAEYRLVSKAEIMADDARIAKQYPRTFQCSATWFDRLHRPFGDRVQCGQNKSAGVRADKNRDWRHLVDTEQQQLGPWFKGTDLRRGRMKLLTGAGHAVRM